MRFNSMLVFTFLFASVALASPLQSHPQSLVQKSASASYDPAAEVPYWGGAVYELDSGTLSFITGSVTLPHISGPTNSGIAVMVGIDGASCPNILSVGVDAIVTPNGPIYQAWYDYSNHVTKLNITTSAGDLIQLMVNALDETSFSVAIENFSNGQTVSRELQNNDPLCEQSAEWVVQRLHGAADDGTPALPVANFSAVTFTDAVAAGRNSFHAYQPQGANITEMLNGSFAFVTSVSLGKGSVTIQPV